MRALAVCIFSSFLLLFSAGAAEPDWAKLDQETLRHFQALIRIDTSDPPGHEAPAADYLKRVLEAEGIPVRIFARDPKRPNLVARIKGNGAKKPLLILGHTDVVNVEPSKWPTFGPFSAARDGGYVYGRGTLDDKDNVAAALMTMVALKRAGGTLSRDVIFLAEAGEEGAVQFGIDYMVKEHWPEIEAEYCLAEGGGAVRRGGKLVSNNIATTEKVPTRARLVARGTAGHGSIPLTDNAVARLSQAVARAAGWQTPMKLNDTTRAYFERLAGVSSPEDAARYNSLTHPERSAAVQEYLREHEPRHYSMLRTSISPTMIKAGYRVNVIPAEAEATLDIRTVPDEDVDGFFAALKKVIADDKVEIVRMSTYRSPAPPTRIDTEMFRILEAATKRLYPGAITLPFLLTGGTDMSYLRPRGMQCYGIGPAVDEEDGPKGFGPHSDQERILEAELLRFTRYHYETAAAIAK